MGQRLETPSRFGGRQLWRLGQLLALARDVTGDHFRLAGWAAGEAPHEVRTLSDLSADEVRGEGVLADVARYEYRDSRFGRKRDLYRVNLQDHNILDRLRRPGSVLPFSPLLLYILTHELVHVIRFAKYLAPFHVTEPEREAEERRVHAITQHLLGVVPLPGMKRVLADYRRLAD